MEEILGRSAQSASNHEDRITHIAHVDQGSSLVALVSCNFLHYLTGPGTVTLLGQMAAISSHRESVRHLSPSKPISGQLMLETCGERRPKAHGRDRLGGKEAARAYAVKCFNRAQCENRVDSVQQCEPICGQIEAMDALVLHRAR